jgi:transposase
VVIMDNLKPHKAEGVAQAVERAGARIEPMPPWSPDMTPIEKMFSKVKEMLRAIGARSKEVLITGIGKALDAVGVQDIKGWFQSCGLAVDSNHSRDSPKHTQYGFTLRT